MGAKHNNVLLLLHSILTVESRGATPTFFVYTYALTQMSARHGVQYNTSTNSKVSSTLSMAYRCEVMRRTQYSGHHALRDTGSTGSIVDTPVTTVAPTYYSESGITIYEESHSCTPVQLQYHYTAVLRMAYTSGVLRDQVSCTWGITHSEPLGCTLRYWYWRGTGSTGSIVPAVTALRTNRRRIRVVDFPKRKTVIIHNSTSTVSCIYSTTVYQVCIMHHPHLVPGTGCNRTQLVHTSFLVHEISVSQLGCLVNLKKNMQQRMHNSVNTDLASMSLG